MIPLAIFLLLIVAATIAYPLAALAVAGVGVAVLAVAHHSRPPRTLPARVEHMSLERRVALRRARQELRDIERRSGLPDE